MTRAPASPADSWRPLHPAVAAQASDARLQFHHAAQFAAATGISYLAKQPDDSHTNLEWLHEHDALASRPVPAAAQPHDAVRLAVRPHPFALLLLDGASRPLATLALAGMTLAQAESWVRDRLATHLDPSAYTLAKHYSIPDHAVAHGASFTAPSELEELSAWFADAALVFESLAAARADASDVRCWPHHFDIATLITLETGKTVGVGMEPGDTYYGQPYYYVNLSPSPAPAATLPALAGGGQWHTSEWIGAVLPSSSLNHANQHAQITEFIGSAVDACTRLARSAAGD